jgi:hypothetical protein
MHRDQVLETDLPGKPIGTTKRLRSEGGEMVHMPRLALAEQPLQPRVGQHAGVEDVLQPMQCLLATGMLIQRRHNDT